MGYLHTLHLHVTLHYVHTAQAYSGDRDILNMAALYNNSKEDRRFYCNSDHAGNSEVLNRRRSQNGLMATLNGTGTPVLWPSKASESSVAFASTCESIGEDHADITRIYNYAIGSSRSIRCGKCRSRLNGIFLHSRRNRNGFSKTIHTKQTIV